MRQISFSNKAHGKPRLEIRTPGTGQVRRVDVESSPFTIGRAETAAFQIDSAQVSREHAQLIERNGVWFIRDVGSTNGTRVNGKEVSEALLSDGDILTIAEVDLTFVASSASQFQRMVTQPIASRQRPVATASLPPDVLAARIVTEKALWQAFPVELREIARLDGHGTEALIAPIGFADEAAHGAPTGTGPARHPAADRCRELYRIRAVELAAEREGASSIYVAVDAAEIDQPRRLMSHLERVQELLPDDFALGITLSLRTILDTLKIEEIYRDARDRNLRLAFDEFQGSGAQVTHLDALAPEYLLLSDSMVKDLATSRQPIRRLESVLAACHQMSIQPVLPQIQNEHTILQCQQLGYELAVRPAAPRREAMMAGVRFTT